MHDYDELAYRIMLRDLSRAFVALGLRSDCDDSGPVACRSSDGRILINAFIVPFVVVMKQGVRHRLSDPHIQVLVTVNGTTLEPMYRALNGAPRTVAKSVLYMIAHLLEAHIPNGWVKKLESCTKALGPSPDEQTSLSPTPLLATGS